MRLRACQLSWTIVVPPAGCRIWQAPIYTLLPHRCRRVGHRVLIFASIVCGQDMWEVFACYVPKDFPEELTDRLIRVIRDHLHNA